MRSPGGMVGNLAPKAEKDGEEVSHTTSKLTRQDVFCDLERERERERERGKTKADTTLEAVEMATFLNSKLEQRLCI